MAKKFTFGGKVGDALFNKELLAEDATQRFQRLLQLLDEEKKMAKYRPRTDEAKGLIS